MSKTGLVAEVKSVNNWYYETNKNVPQKALGDLRQAWDRCFKKISKQPKFKKKGQRDSFYLESGTKAKPGINNDGKRVKLPSIGWVKLAEPLPLTAVHNCVISRTANRWFIAIKYEVELPEVATSRPVVGSDCGMYEFKRQLEYKTIKFSSKLIVVDRFFPSSQICSQCGKHRHKMPLKNRVYVCPDCDNVQDRDLNAARNIERWFDGIFIPERSDKAVSSTASACGVDQPDNSHVVATKETGS